ncbi:MAG TPA: 2-amino-4-hydroxy-6-hydroxymethyldihydropteridine diphosphokinase [Blastocatellia bacterium]|nr:2-amino-4-hydroxy-6-hydroxymethyldihydropteridine diphosphokinase [Blastocatellia bacterium]
MTNRPNRADESTSNQLFFSARPESVYLGLGSNLGDREANLRESIERIEALGLEVTNTSSIYETEPVGYKDQPRFLNQVIEVRVMPVFPLHDDGEVAAGLKNSWDKEPGITSFFWISQLLEELLAIERAMGRKRSIPHGPRLIDIDILIYGEMAGGFAETRDEPGSPGYARAGPPFLTLPHPRMHERRFVLEPLCEIAPDLLHPTLKKTCRDLLASLNDPSAVHLLKKS